ncbi:MAG: cytochrome-c oxidase, cbb3-type subunit III [Alphaproteobacteria bacterium]
MSKNREKDDVSGVETTGHEWDGIRELDNPLPRWWLIIFYACIVWSVGYWIAMPAWPLISDYTRGVLGHSQRLDVDAAVAALKADRAGLGEKLAKATPQEIEADPELQQAALAWGKSAFGDNCATCHGAGGGGNVGFPNLNDDIWLWGGTLDDIRQTIKVGVRTANPETRLSEMPAFGRDGILDAAQIADLSEYVLSLSGKSTDAEAVTRATQVFADNCAACHGADGKGMREFGAPNLTDADWLYGGDKDTIVATITNARYGVMPTWEARLDAPTINALAVYVHSLGGGE